MRSPKLTSVVALALLSGAVSGCSCEGEIGMDDGGGMDAGEAADGGPGMDGETPGEDATIVPTDGAVTEVEGGFLLPDGAVVGCLPALCQGRVYACGDCIDNDGDGLIDSRDPGCIGACDRTEDQYDLGIPGGDTATCQRDCYYDSDQGSGNDGCAYDQRCDPLEPDAPRCPFTPEGGSVRCPETQPERCLDNCLPLVPNGCDCFGCCELPAGSGSFVFLGSAGPDGARTCDPDSVGDPTICRPCTPYPGCQNECGECELCIGRDTLPPHCFPPPGDAGMPVDGSTPIDGGPPPPERCTDGRQACGLPGDAPCPASYYCLTGCCIFFE
jgi:hypothetical protein